MGKLLLTGPLRLTSLVTAAISTGSIAALAADIPTRYSGSFPSTQWTSNARGSFSGNSLTLQYTVTRGTMHHTNTANYSCSGISPTRTQCVGSYQSDNGQYKGQERVTITWSGGRPVAMKFGMH
jgi:hypothetical protein